MPLCEGDTIIDDKYHILKLIGEGGMARVWLAEEPKFSSRRVAIKEPRREALTAEDLVEQERRFHQEVEVAAMLDQARVPHVIRALTLEELPDGTPLLVMEYAEGGSLAERIAQHPDGMPIEPAVQITLDICQALQAFHDLPAMPVHRDVKPSNILFDAGGRAYLADFGLCELPGRSGRTQMRGNPHPATPLYSAPEQLESPQSLTPAADLYTLGCVLFEMLTGERYKRHRPGTPPSEVREAVPAWLDEIVTQALAEDPFDRWSSASAMAEVVKAGPGQAESDQRRRALLEAARAAQDEQDWEALRHAVAQLQALDPEAAAPFTEALAAHEKERARQERLAAWYQEAQRVVDQEPQRALKLIRQIRQEASDYPGLAGLHRQAQAAQRRLEEQSGRRWLKGGIVALIGLGLLAVIGVWILPALIAPRPPNPTSTPANPTSELPARQLSTDQLPMLVGTPVPQPAGPITPNNEFEALAASQLTKTAEVIAVQTIEASLSAEEPTAVDVTGTAQALAQRYLTQTAQAVLTATATHRPVSPTSTRLPTATPTTIPTTPPTMTPTPISISIPTPPAPGGKIAFYSARDGNFEIYIMHADGSGQTRLTNNHASDIFPALSPDGRRIAFVSDRDGNFEIYVMNADGSDQTKLTHDPGDDRLPAWSPDGTKIAFNSDRAGNLDLYTMNADGSNLVRLTTSSARDGHSTWSPDGRWIAFNSGPTQDEWEIYIVSATGGNWLRLTDNAVIDWSPTWSPDGSQILFLSKRPSNADIYLMGIDGNSQRKIFGGPGYEWGAVWSPDGQYIAFTSDEDGEDDIYIMRADGSEVRRLTYAGGAYPSWSK